MYYVPAGIFAASNNAYVKAAETAYGYTAARLEALTWESFLLNNLLPVTLGNLVGGMLFVGIPLYVIHRGKLRQEMPVAAKTSAVGRVLKTTFAHETPHPFGTAE